MAQAKIPSSEPNLGTMPPPSPVMGAKPNLTETERDEETSEYYDLEEGKESNLIVPETTNPGVALETSERKKHKKKKKQKKKAAKKQKSEQRSPMTLLLKGPDC